MSMANKLNILTQEGSRRIRNCSLSLPWEEQREYLNQLSIQMMWSGYSQKCRELVIRRVLAKKDNDLFNLKHLDRPIYRTKQERSLIMKEDKSTWFRSSGATATMTIPATKDSRLAKLLREVVKRNPGPVGTSVKIVERPGPPIPRGLARNNPFPRTTCGRTTCPLATSSRGCREDCSSEGILYVAICQKCEEQSTARQQVYIGESSRTLWVRSNQHYEDYQRLAVSNGAKESTTSFMWDHWKDKHQGDTQPDQRNDFRFEIISNHRDPFERQVTEAVRIERALQAGLMMSKEGKEIEVSSLNRRFEHFCPRVRPENLGAGGGQ